MKEISRGMALSFMFTMATVGIFFSGWLLLPQTDKIVSSSLSTFSGNIH